ncbi:TPA: hypothetical protein ACQD71_004184, partial [Yersinia enterocolitica]
TAQRPDDEPDTKNGSLKPTGFLRFIRRGTHHGADIFVHQTPNRFKQAHHKSKSVLQKRG